MNRLSFNDLTERPGTKFANVEIDGSEVVLGSLNSADILEWMADNEDPERNKFSGLRMLIKCMIEPDGKRIGEDLPEAERKALHDACLEKLKKRDSIANGKLVQECLKLNGLKSGKLEAELKNV